MPSPPPPRPLRPRQRKRPAVTPPEAAQQPPSIPGVIDVGASLAEEELLGPLRESCAPQGVKLAQTSEKLIKDTISKGLRDSVRGVHSELSGLRKAYDSMSTTLIILCTTVNNQGVGSERTAQALQRLQGAVRGGFFSFINKSEAPSDGLAAEELAKPVGAADVNASSDLHGKNWETLPLADKQKVAPRNLEVLSNVRDKSNETLVKAMLTADVSAEALPDAADTKEHVHAAVRAVFNVPEDDVLGYLDSWLHFPARQPNSEPVNARVSSKLGLVLPHLLEGFRRHIIPVYFKHINLVLPDVTKDVSEQWIEKDKFTPSDAGTDAVTEALRSLYRRWGAGQRIVTKPSIGNHPHVNSTVGTYALVSLLVRNNVEDTIATLSKTEEEDMKKPPVYQQWQVELGRVSRFLPWDDKVHNGLRLVDGADPQRAEAALTAQQQGRGRGDDFEDGMRSGVVAPQRDDCVGGEP